MTGSLRIGRIVPCTLDRGSNRAIIELVTLLASSVQHTDPNYITWTSNIIKQCTTESKITTSLNNIRILPTRKDTGQLTIAKDWLEVIKESNPLPLSTDTYDEDSHPSWPFATFPSCSVTITHQLTHQDLWINRFINSRQLSIDLHTLHNKLSHHSAVSLFTDGSLTRSTLPDGTVAYSSGAGVIVAQDDEITDEAALELSVNASIIRWPSSTRAELGAIMLALLIVSINCQVTIYTDS